MSLLDAAADLSGKPKLSEYRTCFFFTGSIFERDVDLLVCLSKLVSFLLKSISKLVLYYEGGIPVDETAKTLATCTSR